MGPPLKPSRFVMQSQHAKASTIIQVVANLSLFQRWKHRIWIPMGRTSAISGQARPWKRTQSFKTRIAVRMKLLAEQGSHVGQTGPPLKPSRLVMQSQHAKASTII